MLRTAAIAAMLLAGTLRLPGAQAPDRLPGAQAPDREAVTIVDSGSTNRAGFHILVDPSGTAEMTTSPRRIGPQQQAGPARITIPRPLVERLYADLEAAKPLASLPAAHCMKSASFGSVLTVALGGDKTPDLSCGDGGNLLMKNLIRDANEIIVLFRTN